MNQFLNQNALLVVEELKETISENLADVFKKVMNDAFSHIPTKLWLMTNDQAEARIKMDKSLGRTDTPKNYNSKNKTEEIKSEATTTTKSPTTKPSTTEKSTTTSSTTTIVITTNNTSPFASEETTPKTSTTSTTTESATTTRTEESTSELVENSDVILEEIEESRVDGEESQSARSENNNQLDQLQSESNNRLRAIRLPEAKQ